MRRERDVRTLNVSVGDFIFNTRHYRVTLEAVDGGLTEYVITTDDEALARACAEAFHGGLPIRLSIEIGTVAASPALPEPPIVEAESFTD